jgi:maltooligosyltrehalose trehalohydrolase
VATREGRRREFAAFAQFAGEEVPDPQDPATFERSKLSREGDPALLELHRRLLRARRELDGGAETLALDEDERWLAVRRGEHVLACNFAREPRTVALPCSSVVLATHAETELQDGAVTLPPLAGALLR